MLRVVSEAAFSSRGVQVATGRAAASKDGGNPVARLRCATTQQRCVRPRSCMPTAASARDRLVRVVIVGAAELRSDAAFKRVSSATRAPHGD